MAQQTISNGESGLSVRSKINNNFGELYARNEFTTDEKNKLSGIQENAQVNNILTRAPSKNYCNPIFDRVAGI